VLHVQPEMVGSNNACGGQNIQRTALWRRKYRSRNSVRRWNRCRMRGCHLKDTYKVAHAKSWQTT
jgi:hypothetical protein